MHPATKIQRAFRLFLRLKRKGSAQERVRQTTARLVWESAKKAAVANQTRRFQEHLDRRARRHALECRSAELIQRFVRRQARRRMAMISRQLVLAQSREEARHKQAALKNYRQWMTVMDERGKEEAAQLAFLRATARERDDERKAETRRKRERQQPHSEARKRPPTEARGSAPGRTQRTPTLEEVRAIALDEDPATALVTEAPFASLTSPNGTVGVGRVLSSYMHQPVSMLASGRDLEDEQPPAEGAVRADHAAGAARTRTPYADQNSEGHFDLRGLGGRRTPVTAVDNRS